MSGLRETPRPRYLPNCPRFIYGVDGDLTLSLPSTPIDYALADVGGDIESDSGVRAAFVVREDELLTFTLRFYEQEWPDVQTFIDWVQNGEPFIWMPDADDEDTLYVVQLEAPAVGTTYSTQPHPDYPIVLLLTITITASQYPVEETDALLSPKLVFMDSMSTGKAQTLGGGVNYSETVYGRYFGINGTFTYSPTNGPEGGGCITAQTNGANLSIVPAGAALAQFYHETPEGTIYQGGIISWHNLRGQPISAATVIHQFTPGIVLRIFPDRTFRASRYIGGDVNPWEDLGPVTAYQAPTDGWFCVESHCSRAPFLYTKGGFLSANLYSVDSPRTGYKIVRAIGVYTYALSSESLTGFNVGAPLHTDIGGWGVLGAYGSRKRWFYETYFAPAWPTADGDVTESIQHYLHQEDFALDLAGNPQLVGQDTVWGDLDAAWRNVISMLHDASQSVEPLYQEYIMGTISVFTNRWLSGPFYPLDDIRRITLLNSAMALFKVNLNRASVASIEGISPFVLAGNRLLLGTYNQTFGTFGRLPWYFSGPHPDDHAVGEDGWPLDLNHSAVQMLIKSESGLHKLRRWRAESVPASEWRPLLGYSLAPDHVLTADPETGRTWSPRKLPQVGVQGCMDFVFANPDPSDEANDWVMVDVGQCGLEVAYHKIRIFSLYKHQPPIARFEMYSIDLATGNIQLYDTSVDFNGSYADLLTLTRVMDWGDGTSEDVLGGHDHPFSHHWLLHGSYIAALTVTNQFGLSDTYSQTYIVPVGDATALYSFDYDETDLTLMTVVFTDASTVQNGFVVSWSWDFGDGSPLSHTQNPAHVYLDPGTYTVELTVTGDSGQTDAFSADIEVPEGGIGGGDCTLSADALADLAYVQGDDFDGGNPPLPAYANTAAFDTYYEGVVYRGAYDSAYASTGTDHRIDTSTLFNGHNTLQMDWGTGHYGSGWNSAFTNDGDPTEAFYTSAPFGPTSLWFRLIWNGESGLMSGGGLNIVTISGSNIGHLIYTKNDGHLWLDITHRPISDGHSFTVDSVDLGPVTDFIGRGDAKFGELIGHYTRNLAARTSRFKLWFGEACTLSGVSPSYDSGDVDSHIGTSGTGLSRELALSRIGWFDYSVTPSGAIKHLNIALWEMEPDNVNANPYGVSLT